MSTDARIDAVMRALTPRERALAEIRAYVEGDEPDPGLRKTAPFGQEEDVDRILRPFAELHERSWWLLVIGQAWLFETDVVVGWLCCAAPLLKRLEALEAGVRKQGLKLVDSGSRPVKGAVVLPALPETADWVVGEGVQQLYGSRLPHPFDRPVPFRKMLRLFRRNVPPGLSYRRFELDIIEQVHAEVSAAHYDGEPIMTPEIRRAIDEARTRIDYLRSRAIEWVGPFEFQAPTEEQAKVTRANLLGEWPRSGSNL